MLFAQSRGHEMSFYDGLHDTDLATLRRIVVSCQMSFSAPPDTY